MPCSTRWSPGTRSSGRPFAAAAPTTSRAGFPAGRSSAGLSDSYRHQFEFGKALVDRAAVGLLPPGAITATLREREVLLDLLREGRGLILLISHVGSWQAMMPALSLLKTPVNLLIQREEGDVDRHYFELRGEACPFRIIDPRGYLGGAIEMVAALKRGEVLCVMGDRVFGDSRGVLPVDFLGAPAPFPTGPYKIAAATGAPIAVLFSVKTGPATYQMVFAGVLRVPEHAGRGAQGYRPFAGVLRAPARGVRAGTPLSVLQFLRHVGRPRRRCPGEPVMTTHASGSTCAEIWRTLHFAAIVACAR